MRQAPRTIPRPPDFGALSTTDAHPAVVARSDSEIINGFVGQQLRLVVGNRLICVMASAGVDKAFPFDHPVLVVSTSVKDYQPWPEDLGIDFLPAVALAADRQWIDRMVVLKDGIDARNLARRSGASYAIEWSLTGMAVIDVRTSRIVRRFATRARELTYRCCPLISDAAPGDRCRMYGGGSVSRAIVAAGHWLDRRYLFLEELGCDEACGQASHRSDPQVPTRYRKWLTEREISSAWAGIVSMSQAETEG